VNLLSTSFHLNLKMNQRSLKKKVLHHLSLLSRENLTVEELKKLLLAEMHAELRKVKMMNQKKKYQILRTSKILHENGMSTALCVKMVEMLSVVMVAPT